MSKFQESLKKYLDLFAAQQGFFAGDTRNFEFFKANLSNTNLEDIQSKVSAIDDTDFNKAAAPKEMAEHILKLNIDTRLEKKDLTVVPEIARLKLNGKEENFLHFASLYCNMHRPDVYPIFSNQFFEFYKRYINEYNLDINPDELGRYDVFTKAQDDLIDRYNLKGKMDYFEMRKFAWAYMENVLKEADPLAAKES